MNITPLPPEALRRAADPAGYGFRSTAELEPLDILVGQDRALDALTFGIAIEAPGYNVFILGDEGTGRRTAALDLIRERAASRAAPDDWCYINDFDDPRRPRALSLPAGRARRLAEDIESVISSLTSELPRVLGSEEYQRQRKSILDRLAESRKEIFQYAETEAEKRGLAVVQGPQAILLAPKANGRLLTDEDLAQLPAEQREEIERNRKEVQDLFEDALRHFAEAANKAQEALRELNRRTIATTLAFLLQDLRRRYATLTGVIAFIDAIERDLASVIDKLTLMAELDPDLLTRTLAADEFQRRYHVNVLTSHDDGHAPVVEEPAPSYSNLIGRIEHRVQQGALITDFNMIRAGALLRANGGYLLLDALEVLRRPLAWEALKRAIKSGKLKIEEPGAEFGLVSTVSLDPEPIPLDLKVVLIGSPYLYYILSALDPDFAHIFKVKADFAPTIPRTPEAEHEYARFVEARRRAESLPPFDADAIAATVEYGARLAGDQNRLTARLSEIQDLVREAAFIAARDSDDVVTRAHIDAAIAARRRRLDRLEEDTHRLIETGVLLIESRGTAIGRVNGLSLSMPGDYAFARPTRITATIALGSRGVVDIQREAQLGGPIHSKAVLILGGYLQQRYATVQPLVLNASLAFEQVYDQVEGDSASLAELLALISALAGIPLRQDLAVTGSVNQNGDVQPVGAVSQKVEGFFHACRIQGFTNTQGVVIPARNTQHLMLHPEVVDAARDGRFNIYPVETVDQAISLLFDRPAEEVHDAASARLREFVETWQKLQLSRGEERGKGG